ncbi:hypothetical protein [Streptomyces bugieae]|uniref:Helix-turn-helix domain-containing protein n=1 Tax=Streptomyces bugieae TaxID=3098223 RepID=A0ABU7NL39_9ACTN|nr:hypothetical protein [Streptomyces sp. DSM 41528]
MGYELRRQLREVLGPEITGLQRAVALEITDDANDDTRESWAALEDIARWTGAKDTNVVRNALKRLAAAGWEYRVPIGKGKDGRVLYAVPGIRMTFKVPDFEEVAPATPKGEPPLPQGGATATSETPEGVALASSGVAPAPSEGAPATPFSSPPHDPSRNKDSSPAHAASASKAASSSAKDSQQKEHHLEAFGAFWLTYPKKKAREEAKKAWIAAIERGAQPEHIIQAAQGYARERAGEDPKFTKYPATWLNKGCYDDEPDQPPNGSRSGHLRSVGPKTAPETLSEKERPRALRFGT